MYACIDLKSFYASVECVIRGLDPIKTNLVVADNSRTEKTICLAVTPALKKYGLSGRSRLFEVVTKVRELNKERYKNNHYKKFRGKSINEDELTDNSLELDYIVAPPQMHLYMEYSTKIYNIYLKYFSKEDIYVYSIDEIFCDISAYLKYYNVSPEELIRRVIIDVFMETGITATAGIGTNMYLSKVAMDIVAKHKEADKYGVRIASLNEDSYKRILWEHTPITDFWRVGVGVAKRLGEHNIKTMGDIAYTSIYNEKLLYKLLGINAEFLIDHAWGYEPCTINDIKSYKPKSNSISSGQVLHCPYNYHKTKLIIREMAELLALELVSRNVVTNKLVLTIGYDVDNLSGERFYDGEITIDRYGRSIPKHSHGTINIDYRTSSASIIRNKLVELYERIVNKDLLIRRINMCAMDITVYKDEEINKQFDLFMDYTKIDKEFSMIKELEKEENELQKVMLELKEKYGKNSILKCMNLKEEGTTMLRNSQIGGHRA